MRCLSSDTVIIHHFLYDAQVDFAIQWFAHSLHSTLVYPPLLNQVSLLFCLAIRQSTAHHFRFITLIITSVPIIPSSASVDTRVLYEENGKKINLDFSQLDDTPPSGDNRSNNR